MKRALTIADGHSGSDVGLTPPAWQQTALQAELWNAFVGMIEPIRPIDILIYNGDAIDGKASRWGSTGLITADRIEQVTMATEVVEFIDAKDNYFVYGTPYHVGMGEDFEAMIASNVGGTIEPQLWLEVYGVMFDVKHFISASSVPHGRHTAIARDRLWNLVWADIDQQPRSDIFIRSHVHYHNFVGGSNWLAMTTPALQGLGSKFGSRIPSGTVDFGITWFDVYEDGSFSWDTDIILIETQKVEPYVVGGEDAEGKN
ncbi:MAG: hypothetical protein GWN17_11015 [Candidatus Korarchaeota archaeon]|nr:hypothetical protein [Candidatus Korarchaeota archaeon]